MTEKRRYRRSSIRLDVELIHPGGGRSRARTRDLSIGGLFVEATGETPPEVGASLTVVFLSIPHHGGTHSIKARVQRLTPNGIAMTFMDFGLDDLRIIDAILSSAS